MNRLGRSLALTACLLALTSPVRAQETESLIVPYPELHDEYHTFGYRIAEWDGWLAVSHYAEHVIHIYRRTAAGWELRQSLRGQSGSRFGEALDMNDGRLVVGAMLWGWPAPLRGRVLLYELDQADQWALSETLLPGGFHDQSLFGGAVAIEGDTLIVGAHNYGVPLPASGCAVFYEHNGTEWVEVHRATLPQDHPDVQSMIVRNLGVAIAMDGDAVVLGAGTFSGPGGAFVYERTDAGWSRVAYLEHPEQEVNGSQFGHAVAIKGRTILVGEPRDKPVGPFGSYPPGRVSVFEKMGENWNRTAELRASDGFGGANTGDEFGNGVGLLDEGRAVVGASAINIPGDMAPYDGKIYLFERSSGGWPAQETASFSSSVDVSSGLGTTVEVSDGMIFSAPLYTQSGVLEASGVMVFHMDSGVPFCEADGPELEIIEIDNRASTGPLLAATGCLPGSVGVFLASSRGFRPPLLTASQLCVLLPVLRLAPQEEVTDSETLYRELDFTHPALAGLLSPGPSLSFQLWIREPGGAVRYSNASALIAK